MDDRASVNAALSYVGHSTLLLELAGARLLTDPVLGRGIGHLRRSAPRPGWRTWRRSTRCWFHTPITTISIPRRYGRSRASAR